MRLLNSRKGLIPNLCFLLSTEPWLKQAIPPCIYAGGSIRLHPCMQGILRLDPYMYGRDPKVGSLHICKGGHTRPTCMHARVKKLGIPVGAEHAGAHLLAP